MTKLAKQLKYKVPGITLRIVRERPGEPIKLHGPDCVEHLLEPLKHYAEEHFVVLHLNSQNEVINYQIVSKGTLSSSLVHMREVFKGAIINNAFAIMCAHNHPAESLKPSSADINVTKELIKAGRLLGVPVLDHVIVTARGSISLRESIAEMWD